jgi:MULE transposase domain
MSEKTLSLYNLVMEEIMEAVRGLDDEEGLACERIISDYEEAILSALQTSFPAAHARGCWFHYGQVSNHKFYCASL